MSTIGNPALVQYTVAAYTSTPSSVVTINPVAMTLTPNGNNITRSSPEGFDLVVGGRLPVNIQFTAVDTDGNACAVVGVAIDPNGGGNPPIRSTFPSFLVNANGLTLADNNPSNSSYDFMLLVQNSQNNLGLIDPKITNS